LITYCHSSTNLADLANTGLVDVEIIWLKEIVEKSETAAEHIAHRADCCCAGAGWAK